ILVTRERIATLIVSRTAFTSADRAAIDKTTEGMGFTVFAAPWRQAEDPQMRAILDARSLDALLDASADRYFDFTPPSDRRPFFFNLLKPSGFLVREASLSGGVVGGNLRATRTLIALAVIAAVLVIAIIGSPLLLTGRPQTPRGIFGAGLLYFGIIGFAFMLIQIPFLQRFSVYLGHPTYTFSIILFLMILSAGLGSVASERIDVNRSQRVGWLPIAIGVGVLLEMVLLQPAIDATVAWGLPGRTMIVALFVAPLAFCLGYCFPVGMRVLGQHSDALTAWMWAVNGACGVMASIVAVMISMWIGIHTNLLIAAALYMLLALPLRTLRARPAS
ncbi:MAG TPA: hypothetical protein VFZ38_01360, partial [Vicinamibacterales bacterium]